ALRHAGLLHGSTQGLHGRLGTALHRAEPRRARAPLSRRPHAAGPPLRVGAPALARRYLARLRGVRRVPRRELDARALPELRATRHRLRRLPLPSLPPHGRCRGHRSHLSALARSPPAPGGAPGGCRCALPAAPLPKPARGRRGATLALTRTKRRTYRPNPRSRHGMRALVYSVAPMVIDPHRGGISCDA